MYGFALICWATLSYSIPFDGYSSEMIIEGVVDQGINGDRPQLQHERPNEIQRILEKGTVEFTKSNVCQCICHFLD